jgi:hypothetical protein
MNLFFYHVKGHFNPAPLVNVRFGPMKDSIQASSRQKLCDDGKIWRTSNSPKEEYNIWMTQSSHNPYLQIGKY